MEVGNAPPIFSPWRKPSRGPSRRCAAHLGGPCTVQKTRQEGDFGLGPPLRRYDSRPLLGPPIVPLPRKSARFIRRRRRFADFPPPGPPLQTTQRGGCGPLFGNSPHGAAAGREAGRFERHPRNLKKRHNLRHKHGWRGALQRTRMELGKLAESWLSAIRIPKLARPGKFGRKAFFFWTVHGPFSLARPKKMGGANSAPQVCGARPVSGPAYDIKQMR